MSAKGWKVTLIIMSGVMLELRKKLGTAEFHIILKKTAKKAVKPHMKW